MFDEARYEDWLAARGDHPGFPRPDAIPGFTKNVAASNIAFSAGKKHYLDYEFEQAIREFKRARAGADRTGKAIIGTWMRLAEGDSRRSVSRKAFESTLRDLLLIARLDNRCKGAAGGAIQNMNLMLGLPEERGLPQRDSAGGVV